METDSFLEGCTIVGNFKKVPDHLRTVTDTLQFQCQALGIQVENNLDMDVGAHFPFQFISPDSSIQENQFSFWSDNPLRQGSEAVIQAATGMMSVHGRSIGGIAPLNLPYLSTASAVITLLGCLATAIGKKRGLDVSGFQSSMVSTGLLCVGQYLAGATVEEGAENIPPGTHDQPQRPPFRSADGEVFELETLSPEPWRRFWAALGITQEDAGRGWQSFLQRYAKATSALPESLMTAISSHNFKNIVSLGEVTGVSVCRQRTLQDRASDKDIPLLLTQGPWQLQPESDHSETASRIDSTKPVPQLQSTSDRQRPLTGFTVIESCRRIQGPIAGHLLALLGARVIRIEPPGGDPLRGMPPFAGDCSARFDALNHLKEVREIDIKSPEGRAEVMSLVSEADVFIHNWAPGKAEQLQLDHEHLKSVNPDIVYTYAGGWGIMDGVVQCPGTDFTVQAYSGVAELISGKKADGGGTLFTALDVLGGIIAAQGSVLGLFRKIFHRQGCRVDTSLLGGAALLTHSHLQAIRSHNPRKDSIQVSLFRTCRGHLALSLNQLKDLIPLLAELALTEQDLDQSNLNQKLESALQTRTAQEWVPIFEKIGIPCSEVVESLSELPEQERFKSNLERLTYSRVATPWRFA
ncbi:CoA transferase [Hahella ganghwensis]|uniref:CoA transferase n=1 Tax=Hahella ganghwensis TaxID=286420 RepID=UPI00037A4FB8|nr:CoA transferase [Hahella ganghwensis]